ncbi:MAG: hypothetical protein LBG81_06195 [Coriobacteriaceae bacterium]|nr:hypothetical protein [Coriobacteriaceae bacterium]
MAPCSLAPSYETLVWALVYCIACAIESSLAILTLCALVASCPDGRPCAHVRLSHLLKNR